MKLKKLLTLSQFVDYLDSIKLHGSSPIDRSFKFRAICNYNEFLKAPLKKEMFVNEIRKPVLLEKADRRVYDLFIKRLKVWQKAEKKVIFKDSNKHELYFAHKSQIQWSLLFGWSMKDIADATLGELELKDLEI